MNKTSNISACNTAFDTDANKWMTGLPAMPANSGAWGEYLVDVTQRTILFWDLLRRRSAQYDAQKAQAIPSALNFEAELVLDARTFAKPLLWNSR